MGRHGHSPVERDRVTHQRRRSGSVNEDFRRGRSRSRSKERRNDSDSRHRRSRSGDRRQNGLQLDGLERERFDKYFEIRRLEREKIGTNGIANIWEVINPPAEADSDLESQNGEDNGVQTNEEKVEKNRLKKKKSHKKQNKKKKSSHKKKNHKKHSKKHKKDSGETSDDSEEESEAEEEEAIWVERRNRCEDDDIIGPFLEPEATAGQLDRLELVEICSF